MAAAKVLKKSDQDVITVVTAGITVHEALRAYEVLKNDNLFIRLIDVYSIKPMDKETLEEAARDTKAIITMEDHYPEGGIGEAVRSALAASLTPIHSLAVRKKPRSGKPDQLLDFEEINEAALVKKVKELA